MQDYHIVTTLSSLEQIVQKNLFDIEVLKATVSKMEKAGA